MRFFQQQRRLHRILAGSAVLFAAFVSTGEEAGKDRDRDKAKPAELPAAAAKADELSAQTKEVLGWVNEMGKELTATIEGWIQSGATTPERLFSYLYYPMDDTEPTKYTTDYDSFADRDFPTILEKYFSKSNMVLFAVAMDRNGYVPTHNRQFAQPLTGNRAVDLVNNRTKRIFGDQTGFKAARNTKPYLMQTYARDTGETAADVSVPIVIRGRHWGCARIAFRSVERQQ
jgi:methyl-accepting chemotaxis protein